MESLEMREDFAGVYKGKKVLVTGDTGFKGSWFVIWLLSLGTEVIGYSLPPRTEKDNYVVCGLEKKIRHIDGEVRDGNSLRDVFIKYKPDFAFHFAAQSLVLESYREPLYTFETNIMGTVNFLESARMVSSLQAAIVVTSDKCYENCGGSHAYCETDPLGGKDPYSASKGAAEIVVASYRHSFFTAGDDAKVASVRAGNIIGGGDWAPNRLLPDCIRALSNGEPIVIRNPEAIRPWQHVLDPLCGYLTLGARLCEQGEKYTGGWNFGPLPDNAVSVKGFVEKVIQQWGSGQYIVSQSKTLKAEARSLQLDISKAIDKLNWLPVLDLEKAIDFALQEYKTDTSAPEKVFAQRMEQIRRYFELREGLKG